MSPVTNMMCLEVNNRKPSLEGILQLHSVTRTQVLPAAPVLCSQAGFIFRWLHACMMAAAIVQPTGSLATSSRRGGAPPLTMEQNSWTLSWWHFPDPMPGAGKHPVLVGTVG